MIALYAIWKYLQIKEGRTPTRPVTMVFGAKAAPAYTLAKDTIHLLLCLSRLIDQDPQVSPWLKLVMVENYNGSSAGLLVPACDVSEQIISWRKPEDRWGWRRRICPGRTAWQKADWHWQASSGKWQMS